MGRRKEPEQKNPSLFGNQPISEFEQQPISPFDQKKVFLKNDKEMSEAGIEDQLTDEQRFTLEANRRDQDIEEQRSIYEGFDGSQR